MDKNLEVITVITSYSIHYTKLYDTGYLLGELAVKVKLPKISGYILAGILLNPDLSGIMSDSFVEHTDPLLSISLSFITFSIGGSLSAGKLVITSYSIHYTKLYENSENQSSDQIKFLKRKITLRVSTV